MKVRYFLKRGAIWIDFRMPNGDRKRAPTGVPEGQDKAAEKAAAGIIAKALGGLSVSNGSTSSTVPASQQKQTCMTFEQAYKRAWRDRDKWRASKDKASLQQTYDQVVEYWGKDTALSAATREAVKDWRAAMLLERGKRAGTTLAASTVNHRMSMLNVLLEVADCPPHGVKFLSVKGNRRMRRAREEELQAVAAWCVANHNRKDALTLADLVQVGLQTTARKGELLGLLWTDVYFQMRQVTFRDTKNGESRTVPLTDIAVTILERRKGMGGPGPFTGASKWQLRQLWADARKALGLEDDDEFVFHVATRHEGLSRLGDQGASAFQIKAMSGNTIQAADIYVKPEVESLRALAEGINRQPQAQQQGEQQS
jgi:integrase